MGLVPICYFFVAFRGYECEVLVFEFPLESQVPTAIELPPVRCISMTIGLIIHHALTAIDLSLVRCEVGTHLFSSAPFSTPVVMGLLLF